MNDLLNNVLQAHGGLERWQELTQLRAVVSVGGSSWPSDGVLANTVATVDTHAQRVTWSPFGFDGGSSRFTGNRVEILNTHGEVVAERNDPRSSFAGFTHQSPWDQLHKAYFSGYAFWNYINTPFLLARDGVQTEEIQPWQQDGETWRRLRVRFPENIVTHNTEQTFYFGEDDYLLRRHDYAGDVLGGFTTAHYATNHKTFDGFVFPTKRWVVPRIADGTTLPGPVVVSLDIESISAS